MKLKYIYVNCIVLLVLFATSCTKMNDLHEEYLDKGEIIYAAKLDSVMPAPGNQRIELQMFVTSQRIDKVRIYWDNYTDSLDVQIANQTGVFKKMIDNLPESEYLFQLVSFDKFGNKSLPFEVSARVYGEIYRNSLNNRSINSITFVGEEININWRSAMGAISTVFSYQTVLGDIATITIPANVESFQISDYRPEGAYSYKTLYIPATNAIDTFVTDERSGVFPHLFKYFECDKTLFAEMSLPLDMGRLGWDANERMLRLWDGSVGPQSYPNVFHGNTDKGVITFDMGKVYNNLVQMEETGRDCCGNPINFEIWGIADISNAETTLSSTDAGWSAEAIAKGWTLLKEVVRTDDGKNPLKVDLISSPPPVRYIRLRFKETSGGGAANLSEITFWDAR